MGSGPAQADRVRRNAIAVGDQHGFASGRQPNVFAKLVFEKFDSTDLMPIALEPLLELGPSPFLPGRLPKSNARSATVLVDELHAGGFQGATNRQIVSDRHRGLADRPTRRAE